DEDPEEDPVDYPADGGDDDDDEEESSEDGEDDEMDTERQLLAGRLNMLFRDRRTHAYTRLLMEAEARMSREAWTRATNA
nr:hypothetical protein [Tanacetum cinerariifolium]